jgi:hypothetical protein
MTDDDLGLLLVRYSDNTLSKEDEAVLERELQDNASARAELWRMAEQAVAAGEAGRRHAAQLPNAVLTMPSPKQRRQRRAPWVIAIAAAGAFLAGVLFLVLHGGSNPQLANTAPNSWELDFSIAPERLTGDWRPAGDGDPARIAEVPGLERKPDGTAFAHQTITLRAASHRPVDAFVAVGPDSVLRLKLRMKTPFPLQLMISTRKPDGSFGGNFELTKKYEDLGPQWRTLEVPLSSFKALHPDLGKSPSGNDISVIIISTLHEPVGLEVAGLSVLPRPADKEKQ